MVNEKTAGDNYLLGMDKDSLRRYQLFDRIYQPGTEERFSALGLRPDSNILELGCGIGQTALWMAESIVPEGSVVAFDQSGELVEEGKKLASEKGIENVTFICAKAQEYNYDENFFDLAHTRFVLTYSPYAQDIMKMIYGSLKPSGQFFGEEVYQSYVRHNEPKWFANITAWFAHLIEAGGGNASYGLDRMPSDMLEAGFVDLSVSAYTPVHNQAEIIEMLRLSMSHEMKKNLVDLGIATAEEVEKSIEDAYKDHKDSFISSCTAVHITGIKSS